MKSIFLPLKGTFLLLKGMFLLAKRIFLLLPLLLAGVIAVVAVVAVVAVLGRLLPADFRQRLSRLPGHMMGKMVEHMPEE